MAKTCSIEGCNSPVFSGGKCSRHNPKKPIKKTPLRKKPTGKKTARNDTTTKSKAKKRKKRPLKLVLWDWFSRWNRLTHSDHNGMCKCFTCDYEGYWKGEQIQCGHFRSRKHMSTFIHHDNCRPQCSSCNNPRIGNGKPYEFGKRLNETVGEGTADMLVELEKQTRQYSQDEYEDLIAYYKEETFRLLAEKGLTL